MEWGHPDIILKGKMYTMKNSSFIGYRTGVRTVSQLIDTVKRFPPSSSAAGAIARVMKPILCRSKQWTKYERAARKQLKLMELPRYRNWVHLVVHYYPENWASRPDIDGIVTAMMDLLQDNDKALFRGVYANDKQVACVDGSRLMLPDNNNPRVEIWVREYIPSACEFRG